MTVSLPPQLFILCGLPFAGKSTLGSALAQHYGWRYLALDDIMTTLGLWQLPTLTQAHWDSAFRTAYAALYCLLGSGIPVVYDATNHTRQQRDAVRTATAAATCYTAVIYVATPPVLVHARLAANRAVPTRGDLSDAELAYVIAHFEAPSADEHVFAFTPPTVLDAWIEAFADNWE